MKKDTFMAVVMILFACGAAGAQDGKAPVFTLKYEVTEGTIEDPDPDEDVLIPSSIRNTVTFAMRESAKPFTLGLAARYSAKNYLLQAGDYSYLSLDQDTRLAALDVLDLGLAFGGKWAYSPLPDGDGLSKDYLALKTRADAALDLAKGTTLDIGLAAEYDLHAAEVKTRQFYTAGVGLTSRLGEWLLSGRYRGILRLPLGAASGVQVTALNEGSLSLQWDPNR